MAHYHPITLTEMDAFLTRQGFVRLPSSTPDLAKFRVKEAVYAKRIPHDQFALGLRVYTGIVDGESRGVGEDAIRCVLVMRAKDGQVVKVSGDKRVHRVEGWRDNLQNRIDNWSEGLSEQRCPKCGAPMVLRKGKKGKADFMGCATWFLHDAPKQNAQQPAQNAPRATIVPGVGIRVETRAKAVETLVEWLRNEATLDEVARIFSLGINQPVRVTEGANASQPFKDGVAGQPVRPRPMTDNEAEGEIQQWEGGQP